jgi:hypothetical protein
MSVARVTEVDAVSREGFEGCDTTGYKVDPEVTYALGDALDPKGGIDA